ncbi:GTP-dependent dephospho-CoA kinase family protein [Haloparvum sp. PAK95]|uniref:GTP-dependent dephospho-CoA kinase family protein n=1 Tax=Haloparvum sp. PAK95 TaxID=3418962 RepID=UPI003D2F39C1
MLTLPPELRDAFKEPLGPVTTDVEALLQAVDAHREAHDAPEAPLIAIGDVVTYHLRKAGREPDVAMVDGMTEREQVDAAIREAHPDAGEEHVEVANPAGKLSLELLETLYEAVHSSPATVIEVIGEEDLATLPALIVAPDGATVVYGQPGVGMVHVAVDEETRSESLALLHRFEGDVDAALDALGVEQA